MENTISIYKQIVRNKQKITDSLLYLFHLLLSTDRGPNNISYYKTKPLNKVFKEITTLCKLRNWYSNIKTLTKDILYVLGLIISNPVHIVLNGMVFTPTPITQYTYDQFINLTELNIEFNQEHKYMITPSFNQIPTYLYMYDDNPVRHRVSSFIYRKYVCTLHPHVIKFTTKLFKLIVHWDTEGIDYLLQKDKLKTSGEKIFICMLLYYHVHCFNGATVDQVFDYVITHIITNHIEIYSELVEK